MSQKQQKHKIYINYYIQNDQWESISEPNLFVLPGDYLNLNDVKAKTIYDNFPLRDTKYYLRFFLDDKTQNLKGWIDFPPNATIPVYNNGSVYVKALRLPKGINLNFKNDEVYTKKKKEVISSTNKSNQNLMFMEEDAPTQSEKPNDEKKKQKQPIPTTNDSQHKDKPAGAFVIPENLNFNNITEQLKDDSVKDQPSKTQSTTKVNTNKNTTDSSKAAASKTPNPENTKKQDAFSDLDAIFSHIGQEPNKNKSNSPQTKKQEPSKPFDSTLENVFSSTMNFSGPNLEVPDLTSTTSKVSNRPIDRIPSNIDEMEMKSQINEILAKWQEGLNEKKNLLFLLSTLDEVWNCENLNIPSMQTLVNDRASVRTYYKKAMLTFHPDKNSQKDKKTQYIASCLYQILNEANTQYLI